MKKTYKIDVDCANCANKMEEAAKNTAGVKDATVNFMNRFSHHHMSTCSFVNFIITAFYSLSITYC